MKLTTDSAGDVGSYGVAMIHASGRLLQLRFFAAQVATLQVCNWARASERVVGVVLYTSEEVEILAVKAATLKAKVNASRPCAIG